MGKPCAVPGCLSGSGKNWHERKNAGLRSLSLFSVPKSPERLDTWKKILELNLKIGDRICELHFLDRHILKCDTFVIKGTRQSIPRIHWTLTADAVPTKDKQSETDCQDTNPVNSDIPMIDITSNENTDHASSEQNNISHANGQDENIVSNHVVDESVSVVDEGDQTTSETPFTIEFFKKEVQATFLPAYWAWHQASEDSIIFTRYERYQHNVRLHLIIASDLSVTIKTWSGIELNMNTNLISMEDVTDHLAAAEKLAVCEGTGIESKKVDPECEGIVSREEYLRTPRHLRCKYCRDLRRKIYRVNARQVETIELWKKKYAEAKILVKNIRRRNIRLQQKLEIENLKKRVTSVN